MIGRDAIRTEQDKVFNIGVGELDVAEDSVVKAGAALLGNREANRRAFAALDAAQCFFATERTAAIARHSAFGDALRALLLKLLLGTEAVIRVTAVDQSPGCGAIEFHALGLEVRALVPINAQPAQSFEDALHHRRRGALQVGVFDAQHQRAPVMPRV